jgi:regulator of sigma E protease
MTILGFTWYYVLTFLAVLSVLIYVHEFGHYWVARRNRVRVEVFSIGFGTELWGRTDRYGTRWKICAIPLGGYVKMFGEYMPNEDESENERPLTSEEQAESFTHKRLGQRTAIVAAGPVANFLFAIFVFAAVFSLYGNPVPLAVVGEVVSGTPAAESGLRPGDKILAIESETVTTFDDVRRIVGAHPDVPIRLRIVRDNTETTIIATPRGTAEADAGKGARVGRIGIKPDPAEIAYERQNPLMALWMGAERTVSLTGQILSYLGKIVTGRQDARDLGGPLRIAQMSGEVAQDGGLVSLLLFTAVLSVNLGLINLFPIPMLDGGHLLFYAAEAVRGRPLPARAQEYGFRFGLALVLLLTVFATWNDLVNLKVIEFLRQLIT